MGLLSILTCMHGNLMDFKNTPKLGKTRKSFMT